MFFIVLAVAAVIAAIPVILARRWLRSSSNRFPYLFTLLLVISTAIFVLTLNPVRDGNVGDWIKIVVTALGFSMIVTAQLIVVRKRARRTSTTISLNLITSTLGIVCILASVFGTLSIWRSVEHARDTDRSIDVPVAWYTDAAVVDLSGDAASGGGGQMDVPKPRHFSINAMKHVVRMDPKLLDVRPRAKRLVGTALVPKASTNERFWWAIWKTTPWLFGLIVALLSVRVLWRAADGDPFEPASWKRVRMIGWLLIVGGLLHEFAQMYLSDIATMEHNRIWMGTAPSSTPVSLRGVVPGLAVLALASIFLIGTRMREQEQLTV